MRGITSVTRLFYLINDSNKAMFYAKLSYAV